MPKNPVPKAPKATKTFLVKKQASRQGPWPMPQASRRSKRKGSMVGTMFQGWTKTLPKAGGVSASGFSIPHPLGGTIRFAKKRKAR